MITNRSSAWMLALLAISPTVWQTSAQTLTRYVDPFIGTASGGNTFPGAVRPWGMVSVSPHNDLGAASGYIHGRPFFYGFGHVHLSGTGCADLGSVLLTVTNKGVATSPEEWKIRYADERAEPGYYAVRLPDVDAYAEVTTTIHCGITRFTFPHKGEAVVQIDAGRSLGLVGGGSVRVVSAQEVEGYNIAGGFCAEANRQTVYFVARLSRKPDGSGTWKGDVISDGSFTTARDSSVGAWFRFHMNAGDTIGVAVGVSYVSTSNARLNLEEEIGRRSFEEVRHEAQAAWEHELSKIVVKGGGERDLARFYTALYHCLIHPNVVTDINGEYPLMGRSGVGRYRDRSRYGVFSLWDTYRTLHPLLTLVYPERQAEMVQTMIDMYKESGWLPKWELIGNETHLMVGDPAVQVIADTYLKGLRDFDTVTAYEALRKHGTNLGDGSEATRPGYQDYLTLGYIPVDQDTSRPWWVWGPVSTTLEYCVADWSFGRFAKSIGNAADANEFDRRSKFYVNLFNLTTAFLRPRRSDGSWLEPFDPTSLEGSCSWPGSGGPGYVEGNAWQYTWFVPHDVPGLCVRFGGADRCVQKLKKCFDNGQFNIANEPDLAYPYLFTYFPGHEHLTSTYVRSILNKHFRIGPEGLPGNDDAGTLSAWFVFSALGFYPACPASGEYRLGVPLFTEARILLDRHQYKGKEVIIRRENGAGDASRVISVSWSGERIQGYAIEHKLLVQGGTLVFRVGR